MRYTLTILAIILTACTGSPTKRQSNVVFVSIAPLAYLVEQIADTSLRVEVLVPETTSPETFEPTTAQIQRLSTARAYINIGLIDFETELNKSIVKLSDSLRVLDLSSGIDVMEGSCAHGEHSGGGHSHGIDPHTWLSPVLMRGFAVKIGALLTEVYPQNSAIHDARLADLLTRIDTLDSYIRTQKLGNFAIAHPSLTYYAKEYGVEQIAIEIEGKEPTIAQMKGIISEVRADKIDRIFYQKQTSAAAAQTIAREVGARVIEFDPLARDWIRNMYFITDQIAR